jgi:hypothetical protein
MNDINVQMRMVALPLLLVAILLTGIIHVIPTVSAIAPGAPLDGSTTPTSDKPTPYQVSIEISLHDTNNQNDNNGGDKSNDGNDEAATVAAALDAKRKQGLVAAPTSYYATYDATELAALYGIGAKPGAVAYVAALIFSFIIAHYLRLSLHHI